MQKDTLQFTKKIFNFYIFSNIHVALATFCLTKLTLIEIGISENTTPLFVFFSTVISYNTIRFLRISDINSWQNKWLKDHKKILFFLVAISLITLVYLTIQLRLKAVLVLIPFAIATLFYTFPIEKLSLRNIPGLKLFLIAFSWAGITVLFPLIQNYMSIRGTDWITFIQRFLFVIVITIPFDIRDINYDQNKLKTLPQQLGISKSKVIGLLLIILFLFLEFLKIDFTSKSILVILLISVLTSIFLVNSSDKQSKYYSAFFVEGIPLFWLITVYGFQYQ